jgi:hypothetical protein
MLLSSLYYLDVYAQDILVEKTLQQNKSVCSGHKQGRQVGRQDRQARLIDVTN